MLKADPIEIRGEKVVLKRAIPKGKFQLMHKDVIFQKKVRFSSMFLSKLNYIF